MSEILEKILMPPFLFAVLLPASIIDVRKRIIPNGFPLLLLFGGLADILYRIFWRRENPRECLFSALVGIAVAAAVCLICRLAIKDGIGMGDVKLLLALALYQRIPLFPAMLLLSSVLALITSSILFLQKKVNRASTLPFAPFLAAGAITAQTFGSILG